MDQAYEENPLLAVSVTDPPSQNVVVPLGVMVGALGSGLTVTTVAAEVPEQPDADPVTVNEPDAVTVIEGVVAPFDQR